MEKNGLSGKRKLLVVHCGGLGDFLLTFPALRALGCGWRVSVAGARERMALAVAFGVAELALDLDGLDFASVFGTPGERLKAGLSAFDGVLVWMRDDDGRIAAGLGQAGARQMWCVPGVPPPEWGRHASAYFFERVRGLAPGGAAPMTAADVSPQPGTHAFAHDVLLHAGSGGKQKDWPLPRFVALAVALERAGRRVAWVRGPAEADMAMPNDAEVLSPETPTALAAVLAGARLYVGNDSGVSHLAGMSGCEVVAIFGPTDPAVWRPLGKKVTVVRKGEDGDWPSMEEVLAAAGSLGGIGPIRRI